MMPKPTIRLSDIKAMGIIILFPSGVLYSNQTGGYSCLHPEEEGVFVPLFDELHDQESLLLKHFTEKWEGCCSNGIDVETADYIDQVLSLSHFTSHIKVDRCRLNDSHEAWVYVDITPAGEPVVVLSGFQNSKGVLTWHNSD